MTQERIDKPTPNGGAYSIAYWFDDEGNSVPKDQATSAEIVEYDKDDNQIHRTYMKRDSA